MDDTGPVPRHRTVGRTAASSYRDFARLRPTPYPLVPQTQASSPGTRTPSPKHRPIRPARRSVSPPKSSRPSVPSPTHSDRFIPYSSSPVSLRHLLSSPPPILHRDGSQSPTNPQLQSPGKSPEWPNSYDDTLHTHRLANALDIDISPKLLKFGPRSSPPGRSPPPSPQREDLFPTQLDPPALLRRQAKSRNVRPDPFRILDAPELHDDYYAQPLSWCVDGTIAVALGMDVFLWSERDGSVRSLLKEGVQDITSVAFNSTGDILAVAREDGSVLLQSPIESVPRIHIAPISDDTVGALSWRPSPTHRSSQKKIDEILVIGCYDGQIVLVNITWFLETFSAKVTRRGGWSDVHSDQICGIAWSNDGLSFATGGNDNRVCLFDIPMGTLGMDNPWQMKRSWTHDAAVKALAFKSGKGGILAAGSAPFSNTFSLHVCQWWTMLTSGGVGGGVHDKKIRFYNTFHGTLVSSLDVDAQITTLLWSPNQSEILATFGYTAHGITTKCAVYAYPSLQCLFAFEIADEIRALYAVPSPSGREICLAGSDECIRFYRIWGGAEESREGSPVRDLVEGREVQFSGRANELVGQDRFGLSVIR